MTHKEIYTDGSKEIRLTRGRVALVDSDYFEWLSQWKWHCSKSGYAVRMKPKVKGEKRGYIWMHREINNTPENMYTDHINGNKLDNRRINLRTATPSQNSVNKKFPKTKSGYRGVCFHGFSKMWMVRVMKDYKLFYSGYFKCRHRAAMAYNLASVKAFGSFAKLNIVKPFN